MARKKNDPPESAATEAEPLAHLTEAVTTLTDTMKDLTQQVDVLWRAIDELRVDLCWALENGRIGPAGDEQWRPITHVTSLPRNPCDPAFGSKINRTSASALPPELLASEESAARTEQTATRQKFLWE